MKEFLYLLITILFLSACNSESDEQKKTQFIDPNKIRINDIVHDTLSQDQLTKIKKIHSIFQEVDKISLEETITDFKRDQNPDNEIKIWLTMANAYQNYLNSKNKEIDLNTKTEVYQLILSRSMMSNEEAIKNSNLVILSKNEAEKVLSFYKAAPDPIDIVRK